MKYLGMDDYIELSWEEREAISTWVKAHDVRLATDAYEMRPGLTLLLIMITEPSELWRKHGRFPRRPRRILSEIPFPWPNKQPQQETNTHESR